MTHSNAAAPSPLGASKATISAFAEELAEALEFRAADPIEPLVARLGGRIEFKDPIGSGGRLPESIVIRSMQDFTIFLPTMTSLARDRFTIAHELGHLFVHFPGLAKQDPAAQMMATRWVDQADAQQQRAEWEANWFAAAFLMPERDFRLHLDRHGIERTAERFAVTRSAVSVRAKSLGLQNAMP